MSNSNERFFRMLSIALLGAVALACVPDSQADADGNMPFASIEIELTSLQDVEDINAGRFNPAVAGDSLAITTDLNTELATEISAINTHEFVR